MADRIQCRSRRSTESLSAIIEDSISKTLQANEDIDNNEKQRIFDRFKEVIMLELCWNIEAVCMLTGLFTKNNNLSSCKYE